MAATMMLARFCAMCRRGPHSASMEDAKKVCVRRESNPERMLIAPMRRTMEGRHVTTTPQTLDCDEHTQHNISSFYHDDAAAPSASQPLATINCIGDSQVTEQVFPATASTMPRLSKRPHDVHRGRNAGQFEPVRLAHPVSCQKGGPHDTWPALGSTIFFPDMSMMRLPRRPSRWC